MLRGRRKRLAGSLLAAACALAAWAAAPVIAGLTGDWGPNCPAARLAGAFLGIFPLVMILAAAFGAAGAVLAERVEDTAMQVVLTPLGRRTILAAKTWPHLWTAFWGLAAALPLYLWLGGSERLTGPGLSTVCVFSPLRLLLLGPWFSGADAWELAWSLRGCGIGLVMWLTDLGLVWAAAQWGAAAAVRRLSLGRAAWDVAVSLANVGGFLWFATLALVGVLGLLAMLGSLLVDALSAGLSGRLAAPATVALAATGLGLLAVFWWRHVISKPLHEALAAFAWFDAVVDDDFRPPEPDQPRPRWKLPPVRP